MTVAANASDPLDEDAYQEKKGALLATMSAYVSQLAWMAETRRAAKAAVPSRPTAATTSPAPERKRRLSPEASRLVASEGLTGPQAGAGVLGQAHEPRRAAVKAQPEAAGQKDTSADKDGANVSERLDRDARHLMAARGLGYRDALMLAASDSAANPGTLIQGRRPATPAETGAPGLSASERI